MFVRVAAQRSLLVGILDLLQDSNSSLVRSNLSTHGNDEELELRNVDMLDGAINHTPIIA